MQPSTVKDDLKTAHKDLAELRDELPQFQALLSENEGDAARLKSERVALDDQAQAKNRVLVAREMLEQHRADLKAAEHRVAELQTQADRDDLLGVVRSASERFPAIKTQLEQLFAETDAVLVAAIQQAKVLADEGNEQRLLAGNAVNRLIGAGPVSYERDRAGREEVYARAVDGTDILPLSGYTQALQSWPADYAGSPYKTLGHFQPDSTGLTMQRSIPTVNVVQDDGPTIDDVLAEMTGRS